MHSKLGSAFRYLVLPLAGVAFIAGATGALLATASVTPATRYDFVKDFQPLIASMIGILGVTIGALAAFAKIASDQKERDERALAEGVTALSRLTVVGRNLAGVALAVIEAADIASVKYLWQHFFERTCRSGIVRAEAAAPELWRAMPRVNAVAVDQITSKIDNLEHSLAEARELCIRLDVSRADTYASTFYEVDRICINMIRQMQRVEPEWPFREIRFARPEQIREIEAR